MKSLFGTDGIRGVANSEPLVPETIVKIAQAAAYYFLKNNSAKTVLIGKDTRISGYVLESSLIAGFCSFGIDVKRAKVIPTPGVAFLLKKGVADVGIVISASHNPAIDNGIKFFSGDGFKLSDDIEKTIESIYYDGVYLKHRPPGTQMGKVYNYEPSEDEYTDFLLQNYFGPSPLKGRKIVIDCANGASYKIAPYIFRKLGAEVIAVNIYPSGLNINLKCGALYPENLKDEVLKHKADCGITFDGDADRVMFLDEKGSVADGDKIISVCAAYFKEKGRLDPPAVVLTVMSNKGTENYLRGLGIEVKRSAVGDRYVVEEMMKSGIKIGGEQSGHIIFYERANTGDGMLTAVVLLSILSDTGRPLSELTSGIKTYPQLIRNIKVKKKKEFKDIKGYPEALSWAEEKLKNNGRILVRYSGTELLARVMVEGENSIEINHIADVLADKINSDIGLDS